MEKLEQDKVTIMAATHDLDQAAQHFNRIFLLNHHLIRVGASQDVLTPENLKIAYGGRLRLMDDGKSMMALDHSCCEGGEE